MAEWFGYLVGGGPYAYLDFRDEPRVLAAHATGDELQQVQRTFASSGDMPVSRTGGTLGQQLGRRP